MLVVIFDAAKFCNSKQLTLYLRVEGMEWVGNEMKYSIL